MLGDITGSCSPRLACCYFPCSRCVSCWECHVHLSVELRGRAETLGTWIRHQSSFLERDQDTENRAVPPKKSYCWGKVGGFTFLGPLEKNMGVSTILINCPSPSRTPCGKASQAGWSFRPLFHIINKWLSWGLGWKPKWASTNSKYLRLPRELS